MRARAAVIVIALVMAMVAVSWAQDKADVGMEKPGLFKPGDTIVFNVSLDAPIPKGAHLELHISPISSVIEDILLVQNDMGDAKTFQISYKLPEGALPGKWHMSGIYLFLPGSRKSNKITFPKNLSFKVEGKPYQIPKKADVTVGH
jgi:hypothetical protein